MKQHPVPQNVTSYQFRLVGDMTLKQFLELLAGVLLAYLFFASNLLFFIKWPLVLVSIFGGVAFAFFPIEERPLDQWAINFIKSIYSPVKYIWKKTPHTPSIFTYQKPDQRSSESIKKDTKTPAIQIAASFQQEEMDTQEQSRLQKISDLLAKLPSSPPSSAPTPKPVKTKPKISVRKLKPRKQTTVYQARTPPAQQPTTNNPQPKTKNQKSSAKNQRPTANDQQPATKSETIIFQKPTTIKKSNKKQPKKSVSFAHNMPLKPKKPNLVVGMVTNQEGHLAEDIIVQINNAEGTPQRAIKTNKLGQFFISTPLSKGEYTIEVEDDSLSIPPRKLSIKDEIIPPLHLHPDKQSKPNNQ